MVKSNGNAFTYTFSYCIDSAKKYLVIFLDADTRK